MKTLNKKSMIRVQGVLGIGMILLTWLGLAYGG